MEESKMKNIKKLIALLLATCIVASLAACGSQESETSDNLGEVSSTNPVSDDQAAADEVAKLIDAIYVQERNENTDEQCEAAKAAWDALTMPKRNWFPANLQIQTILDGILEMLLKMIPATVMKSAKMNCS